MKSSFFQVSANPRHAKIYNWVKLITFTGGAQAVVQGAGLLCGILVIRLLPTQEYVWYTLANSMLGTMALLADAGISTGVMAEGGRVWQDKDKLGAVLATGLDLRKKFAIGSLIIAIPLLSYFLLTNGANWLMTILVVATLIPAFLAALSDSLLEIIPRLHQDIGPLQKNQLAVSVGRLILSSVALFVFPFAFVAIFASSLPRTYGNIQLRKIAEPFINSNQRPDPEVRNSILKIVKRGLPELLYFTFSSQITIWLLALFGSSTSIAQVGAISRLGMVINLVNVLFTILVIPRFAKAESSPELLSKFFKISFSVVLLSMFISLLVWLFSDAILAVLGNNYKNLQHELFLYSLNSCVGLLISVCFGLYSSRGWIIKPALALTSNITFLVAGILIFNVSTVTGVLLFNLFIACCQVVLHFSFAVSKLKRIG